MKLRMKIWNLSKRQQYYLIGENSVLQLATKQKCVLVIHVGTFIKENLQNSEIFRITKI